MDGVQITNSAPAAGISTTDDTATPEAINARRRAALLQAWQQHIGGDPQAAQQPLDIVSGAQPTGSNWMTSAAIKGPQYAPPSPMDLSSQTFQPMPVQFTVPESPLQSLSDSLSKQLAPTKKQDQQQPSLSGLPGFWAQLFGGGDKSTGID